MKKINLIAFAAIAMIGFSGCTNESLADLDQKSGDIENENVPINFGTYLGNAKSTRADYEGGSINTTDQLKDANGFGIFAINTEINKYKPDNADNHTLYGDYNYMFNQQVTGKATDGTITWETDPVKYWPNKTLQKSTDGKLQPQYVTFFAYAPYCKIADQTEGNEENFNWWESYALSHGGSADFKGGIIAMSTSQYFEQDIAETDKNKWFSKADPVIALDLTNASSQTDLLWGTAGENGKTEDGEDQDVRFFKNNAGSTTEGALGGNYNVNADLTKMKTDGKVSFAFKHTLARIGGHKANEADNENSITIDAVADALNNSTATQLKSATRISLKWLAIEVMGTTDGNNSVAYPTKGFFNLATGLWGQMAKDPTGSTIMNQDVEYKRENNPVYVLYPNGVTNFNYANVTPYLNNTTSNNFKKIPFNSVLAVNGDGGDSYDDFIKTTDEDEYQEPPTAATSTWYTKPTQEGSGSEEEGNTKKVPNAGVTTTSQSVFVNEEDAEPLLIIPNSTIKPKIRVIASYDIVTPDPAYNNASGHKGYTKANQVVGKDITFANVAELNKKYNLHIHLGVTSMKVDATVDDWEGDTTGTGESAVEETKDIDLPANVEPTTGGTTPNP